MIARLRQLATRPITGRSRTFLLVAAALAALAVGLVMTAGPPTTQVAHPAAADRPRAGEARVASAAPTPRPAPAIPAARARRVARRFLAGYLAALYGRGSWSAIPGATPALRDRLSSGAVRVPPAAQRRHPRAARLRVSPGTGVAERRVVATVADGSVSYPIGVLVRQAPDGRPLVADVLEDQ